MRARGQIKKARCPVPGHGTGHAHAERKHWPRGSICEVVAERLLVTLPRSSEKRYWQRDVLDNE